MCLLFSFNLIQAQSTLKIEDGQVVQSGGFLVIQDGKLVNDGTYTATDGTVLVIGTATDANSTIEGTGTSTFNDLSINKSSNNVLLETDVNVANTLTLTNGLLDIGNNNLIILNGGVTAAANANSYVKTSGTGVLIQQVGGTAVLFPVGNDRYTPATLQNAGTSDMYSLRTEPIVYLGGTTGMPITEKVVDVTWFIDETAAGGSDVSLTLQWNGVEELTDFDRTQAFVANYESNVWLQLANPQAVIGSDPYTITQDNVTSFSPFSVSSDITVLPVELLYFYGEKVDDQVRLNWETATELNNDYFEVEWSTNTKTFKPIGQVKGAGTTLEKQSYELLHPNPAAGINYYRLKQFDFDGSFEYSDIVAVKFDSNSKDELSVFPNPSSNTTVSVLTNQTGTLQVFNVAGQLVLEIAELNRSTIDISQLNAGIYFVKVGSLMTKLVVE
ncbi:MAG: T9SS type A sorting domain-containing protein [Bacteroidota bacterium]